MTDIGQIIRLIVIVMSFVAMWSLFEARRKRRYLWTPKMRDIWFVQIGWPVAAAEANIELFYRHAQPSVAIGLVIYLLYRSIRASMKPGKYTIDQPDS